MKRGDKGMFVGILQKTLAEAGFDPGPVDGIYGPKTEAAVKKFQQSRPADLLLPLSGEADGKTWTALQAYHKTVMEEKPSRDTGEGDDSLSTGDGTSEETMPTAHPPGVGDYGGNESAKQHPVWTAAYTQALDIGFSEDVSAALADEAVHQALYEQHVSEGYSEEVALDLANEEVPSAVPWDKRGEYAEVPTGGDGPSSEQAAAIAEAIEEYGEEAVDSLFRMLGGKDTVPNQEAVSGHPAWQGAYDSSRAAGFSEEVSVAIANATVHGALFQQHLDEGYAPDVALQLANEEVPSQAKSEGALATVTTDSPGGGTLDGTGTTSDGDTGDADADTNANAFFGDTTTPDGTGTPDGGTPVDGPWGTVEALQEALLAAGFDPGPIDGIMGPLTRAAMEAFNVSIGGSGWGISADGWVTLLGTRQGEGDSTEPPDEIVTDEDIANLAAAYGYGARWLNHEELGPILRQAAEEGWYDNATGLARLEAAIKATDWWDDFDANERNHQLLEASDPAEAERLLDLQVDMLHRAATRLGLTIADDRVREMARAAHVENWSDYQINQNMLLEAEWAPGQAGGAVEDNYAIIDALAGDYFVDHLIDDTTKDEWARALYLGDITEMGIRNDISALAQSSFPSMEARISQGYSTRQIVAPLRQEAARLLEIDATSIDFMTDPRFQPIWQQQNDDGTTRVMSVAEVGQYVRGLEDWQTTTNATNDAYRFADYIGKKFGKAA